MGLLREEDAKLTLEHARKIQEAECVPPASQKPAPDGSFGLFVLFNLEAAYDEGHAILALGPVGGPLQTYSYYRPTPKLRAPALVASLLRPMTFDELERSSGWLIHGVDHNYWNEHVNAAVALWCGRDAYEMIRAVADQTKDAPGIYDLVTHNCLHFVEDALSAGGVRLTTKSGRDLHTIIPKDAFAEVSGAQGAERLGEWKYWFPIAPEPDNGYRSIPDEIERTADQAPAARKAHGEI